MSWPSDRVRGCGTVQFGQSRTITHNPRKFARSRTIWKCLLEILIKMGISNLSSKISRLFSDYFQTIYLQKQLVNCVIQTTRHSYRSLRCPGHYLDIHDVLRGLLGLMGRSPQVFSFSSFDIALTSV